MLFSNRYRVSGLRFRHKDSKTGSHVERPVCFSKIYAGLLNNKLQNRRNRRNLREAVDKRRGVPHQLSPAVAGDVREIMDSNPGGKHRFHYRRIQNRWVEQGLAVQPAISKSACISFRELIGEFSGE